ncbi:methyltransferase domain-containing protein [Streptomyces sp. P9-A4]|uniref:methyltransferase domain-containing protein n=1 Tax=Streptomyces sp. P9-A4 TaxID=3072285 RepID=UPI003FCC4640
MPHCPGSCPARRTSRSRPRERRTPSGPSPATWLPAGAPGPPQKPAFSADSSTSSPQTGTAPKLATAFTSVLSLDLSEQMLHQATGRSPARVRGDASALPVADASIAAVAAIDMLLFPHRNRPGPGPGGRAPVDQPARPRRPAVPVGRRCQGGSTWTLDGKRSRSRLGNLGPAATAVTVSRRSRRISSRRVQREQQRGADRDQHARQTGPLSSGVRRNSLRTVVARKTSARHRSPR